jgi:hypothetical protein
MAEKKTTTKKAKKKAVKKKAVKRTAKKKVVKKEAEKDRKASRKSGNTGSNQFENQDLHEVIHLQKLRNTLTAKRAEYIVSSGITFKTSTYILEEYDLINPDAARIIASVPKGGLLDLSGIVELSTEAATALASYRGYLGLHSLRKLSLSAAKAILTHKGKGTIYLGALGDVSDEVADLICQLCDCRGGKRFVGPFGRLAELKKQSLRLKSFQKLSLGTKLTVSIAKRIQSKKISPYIITGCFHEIDEDAAEILASSVKDKLDLRGLKTLSANSAENLLNFSGSLNLSGLRMLGTEVAGIIGKKWRGRREGVELRLDGLHRLTNEETKELSHCRSPISLDGVETLSLEQICCLKKVSSKYGRYWTSYQTTASDISLQGLLYVDLQSLETLASKKRTFCIDELFAVEAKRINLRRTILPKLYEAGFFNYSSIKKQKLSQIKYPANGPHGIYAANLRNNRSVNIRRLYSADVEELLERGPYWFLANNLKHLGISSKLRKEIKLNENGIWACNKAHYVISGPNIEGSSSLRAMYALVALLNEFLSDQGCHDRAYGVDDGNNFAIAFLTPPLASLIRKVADREFCPQSEDQLESLANQSMAKNEPPLVINN